MQILDDVVLSKFNYGKMFECPKDTIYCKVCGKESIEESCFRCSCGSTDYITGELSYSLYKYLMLKRNGNLRQYYIERCNRDSIVKMNSKRIIYQLLIKDGFIKANDGYIEEVIGRIVNKNL